MGGAINAKIGNSLVRLERLSRAGPGASGSPRQDRITSKPRRLRPCFPTYLVLKQRLGPGVEVFDKTARRHRPAGPIGLSRPSRQFGTPVLNFTAAVSFSRRRLRPPRRGG